MTPIDEDDSDWDDDSENGESDDGCDTIPCPYCGNEIAEDAPRCSACGNYISREDSKSPLQKPWIIVTAIVCVVIVLWWVIGH